MIPWTNTVNSLLVNMLRGVRLADPTAGITPSVWNTFEYHHLPVHDEVFAVIRVRKYVIVDVDIFMSFQSGVGKYRARFTIENITEFKHGPQYILADRHHHPSISRSFEFFDAVPLRSGLWRIR